ncbi:hypothetical protein NESM_000209000 [Novymonas esmeraldas]|uniref:Uncharacterized protein n=1 Tax=Novymonas esmeraldas TaxID=1808958 RepID=A0AAW0F4G7_9TRYP
MPSSRKAAPPPPLSSPHARGGDVTATVLHDVMKTVAGRYSAGSVNSSASSTSISTTFAPSHNLGTQLPGAHVPPLLRPAYSHTGSAPGDTPALQSPSLRGETLQHRPQEQRQLAQQPQQSSPQRLGLPSTPTATALDTPLASATGSSRTGVGSPTASTPTPTPTTTTATAAAAGSADELEMRSLLLRGPPYEGVYLQPSTFKIGASGGDVLWALVQSSGTVAAYVDGADEEDTPVEDTREFAVAAKEIVCCLSGGGACTAALLSFDFVIEPARRRTLAEVEADATLRAHPATAQLLATDVNRMEEVAPRPPLDDDGDINNDDGGARVHRASASPAAAVPHTKTAWLQSLSAAAAAVEAGMNGGNSSSGGGGGDGGEAEAAAQRGRDRRRRACATLVQSCLLAARRVGTADALCFSEVVCDSGSGCCPTARGAVDGVLCGGAAGDGAATAALAPLWSGVQVALASMTVGEEASFLLGPADAAMFSAPLDGAAYVRSAAAALSAACAVGSSRGGGGGGGSDATTPCTGVGAASGLGGSANHSQRNAVTFTEATATVATGRSLRSSGGGGGGRRTRNSVPSPDTGLRRAHRHRGGSDGSVALSPSPAASSRSSSAAVLSSRSSSSDAGGHARASRTGSSSGVSTPVRKSTFFSRVREWGRRGSRAGVDGKHATAPPGSPPLSSSTSSAPLLRTGAGKTPTSSMQRRATTTTTTATMVSYDSPEMQRLSSPSATHPTRGSVSTAAAAPPPAGSHGRPPRRSPLPSSQLGDSVVAYEVASHSCAEPVLLHLRLRERVPMLPLRSAGAHAPILASAAPAPAAVLLTTAEGAMDGVVAEVAATAHASPRCRLSTAALRCLRHTHLLQREFTTPFHCLCRSRPSAAATAHAGVTLADLMASRLGGQSAATLGRAALFTCVAQSMDAKLLCASDRARCVAPPAPALTGNGNSPLRCDDDGGGGGDVGNDPVSAEDTVLMASSTTTTATATLDAAAAHRAGAPPASAGGYTWVPPHTVRDAVDDYVSHLRRRRGTGDDGNEEDDAAALQRVLAAFTRYAHETSPVSFSLDTFDAAHGVYVPYRHPLAAAAAAAAAASSASAAVVRGSIGCVLHPCWLDAVLQSDVSRVGADTLVVTRGHAAEAEERLFVCAMAHDVADAAQAVSRHLREATVAGAVDEAASATSCAGRRGETESTPAPAGVSAGVVPSSAVHVASAAAAEGSAERARRRCSGAGDAAAAAEAMARRRLGHTVELLRGRRAEQVYRVRLHTCAPLLSPTHFFVTSPKDGLAAARALMVDAAALLHYYYHCVDGISTTTTTATAAPSPSQRTATPYGLAGLQLRPAVPAVLRRHASFTARGLRSRQRLPYLLFGTSPGALMAAAAARAQAMGSRSTATWSSSPHSDSGVNTPLPEPSASASLELRGGPAAPATPPPPPPPPPVEVLAAALMLVAPSAATRATTLAARVPLALERVLLKALPKLQLAVLLLTLGVREVDAVPTATLERVHRAWWTRAAATSVDGAGVSTAVPPTASVALSSPAPSASPDGCGGGGGGGGEEEQQQQQQQQQQEDRERLCYRRYTYLGECFHALACLAAELPGMRRMAREAGAMALFYAPRDPALWALWGTLADRLGSAAEARDDMRVAVALVELEAAMGGGGGDAAAATTSRSRRRHVPPPSPASPGACGASCTAEDSVAVDLPHGDTAELLLYARSYLRR